MPVFLHDLNLVDKKFLSAPFVERHLLQGHLQWNWGPWTGEVLLQDSTMTTGRAVLEWWGWAVPTALWLVITHQGSGSDRTTADFSICLSATYRTLARDILSSKLWKNFLKLSPTDLWQHPAHSSPMASVYHLWYYSHRFCKQDFVTVKIYQNSWESSSNSMGFGHYFSNYCCSWLHNKANTCTWWIKSHPKRS